MQQEKHPCKQNKSASINVYMILRTISQINTKGETSMYINSSQYQHVEIQNIELLFIRFSHWLLHHFEIK